MVDFLGGKYRINERFSLCAKQDIGRVAIFEITLKAQRGTFTPVKRVFVCEQQKGNIYAFPRTLPTRCEP